jgi:HpaII restriction endonuclease
MALSGNKGEWSELYAVLVLLAEGRLAIAAHDLSLTGDVYQVVGVQRRYSTGDVAYEIDLANKRVVVTSGTDHTKIDLAELDPAIKLVLAGLTKGSAGNFQIPDVESLLAKMRVHHLAAGGTLKADLEVLVRDTRSGELLRLAFSVKSRMGSPSTLLNASKVTNFRLGVPLGGESLEVLKSHDGSPSALVAHLMEGDHEIGCPVPVNPVLRQNLMLIDSRMDEIVGSMLLGYYSGAGPAVSEIVKWVSGRDPLKIAAYSDPDVFYKYKVQTMLSDFALAMVPGRKWDGTYTANGGYLLVDKSGQLSCLPSTDRDNFREYLFQNTRFETASTTRHQFGRVELDEVTGEPYVNLNLQIRFKI